MPPETYLGIVDKSAALRMLSRQLRSDVRHSTDDAATQSQERLALSRHLLATTKVRTWWPGSNNRPRILFPDVPPNRIEVGDLSAAKINDVRHR